MKRDYTVVVCDGCGRVGLKEKYNLGKFGVDDPSLKSWAIDYEVTDSLGLTAKTYDLCPICYGKYWDKVHLLSQKEFGEVGGVCVG